MHRLDRLTFKQLRALQAVVSEGTISGAAEMLNLTAPAVHNQLKTLESLFGCPLTRRNGAEGFQATPEGQALLTGAREARAALERSIHQIEALNKGLSGSVVLGVVSTGKYFAPGIVAQLRRNLPDIEIVLRIGNRQKILNALAARELDLTIMGRPPRQPALVQRELGPHPHVIVAEPGHPLAALNAVPAEALLQEHFVMREQGSGTRLLATRYLDELGAGRAYAITEMESNETIKQAVMSGLGIAFLSGHTVVEELRTGRLVVLRCPGLPIMRMWHIVTLADKELSKASETVRDWVVEHAYDMLPHFADIEG